MNDATDWSMASSMTSAGSRSSSPATSPDFSSDGPTSLGRMVKRLQPRYQAIHVAAETARVTHPPQIKNCLRCQDAGYLRDKTNPEAIGQIIECPTCQMIARERVAQAESLDPRLGFTPEMRRGGLMELSPDPQQEAAYVALRNWACEPEGWIVVYGARGSGKTTLLAATVTSVRAMGIGALFCVGTNLFELLKNTLAEGTDKGRYGAIVDRIKASPVLVLDDLREIRRTDWAEALLLEIVNDRYNANAPTVVSLYEHPDLPYHPKERRDAEPNESVRSRLHDRRIVRAFVHAGDLDLRAFGGKRC